MTDEDAGTLETRATAAARAGDAAIFGQLTEVYRRELQVHCYRMLGSFEESEDLVQETLLRAWRRRETFAGRSSFRAWLYRIATNACLDVLARYPRSRQRVSASTDPHVSTSDVPWLQPYPDHLLEGIAATDADVSETLIAKETLELTFLVAIQYLPPRQRAVLILRDVVGWSAGEVANLLNGSVASVNSALQRARATLKAHLPPRRLDWTASSTPTADELATLHRYMEASERADMSALAALLRDDARQTMPPESLVFTGREEMIAAWSSVSVGPDAWGTFRLLPTRANRQMAAAVYLRSPSDSEFRAFNLEVLRIEGNLITEVTTFAPSIFAAFGLPETL